MGNYLNAIFRLGGPHLGRMQEFMRTDNRNNAFLRLGYLDRSDLLDDMAENRADFDEKVARRVLTDPSRFAPPSAVYAICRRLKKNKVDGIVKSVLLKEKSNHVRIECYAYLVRRRDFMALCKMAKYLGHKNYRYRCAAVNLLAECSYHDPELKPLVKWAVLGLSCFEKKVPVRSSIAKTMKGVLARGTTKFYRKRVSTRSKTSIAQRAC